MKFECVEHGSTRYQETVEVRRNVLRLPLGLDFIEGDLAAEVGDIHLAAIDDGRVVACLVLTPLGQEVIKMRQVAVDADHQGSGVGRALVEESERFARAQHFKSMVLNAREPVIGFYQKLGYTVEGEPFLEVTIPHRRMSKSL